MTGAHVTLRSWLEPLRGRIMAGVVLLIGLYFVLAFGEQAWHARELEAEVAARLSDLTALQQEREALRQQLGVYNSEAYAGYVEQAARRDLNLAYPEETVLLVRWNEPPAPPLHGDPDTSLQPRPERNWEKWRAILLR
jgi:cell division protein FtsB